ncbi:uncharacterized protein LOC131057373 isoform X2 [Cryptomeria japonica]|uniref:uncharacterized protein LOC131057373 isoform X2 n=1 Tax=Cryptomeria japonica TaxID=3369 RepID=UPI0027DA5128|nr:uncharacterized protein LOC131057373 isoform X2 [Cryptomeria japonica]
MDKSSLISTFAEADTSGWSLQADVQVLKWLEDFSERLKRKASNVTENVHKLLELTGDVEQDFYNTFNSFRALSNTQYIENRVYEDDDIGDPNLDFSVQFSEASLPAQGYEEDIVPRYKEALVTGWNAYRQYIKKTSRNTSEAIPHKVGWNDGNLPHIIGTEEFMRDNSCGLTDDRNLGMDPLDFNSDPEREGIHLESEMAGSRTLLEANWPGTDSDKDDQVGVEPAVSAALDFKAMLEAALRSPYIPYNDGVSNLNGTSSYIGNIGDSFIATEVVAIDSLRNGSPNAPRKNSDVPSALRAVEKIPEDIQTDNIITIASSSIGTFIGDLFAKPTVIGQELPAAAFQRNISSKFPGATDRLGQDGGDEIVTSSQNKYFQSMSQPVDIHQTDEFAKSNQKPQLRVSSQSEQANTSTLVKIDTLEPESSSISKIVNAAVISGLSFVNEEECSSSLTQESANLSSTPTANLQTSMHKDDNEKIVYKSTSRDGERGIINYKPHNDFSGSSSFSKHLQETLFSGGLFDDEDEPVFSNPVESVNVWSQPSVPDRLFVTLSESKKDDGLPSSNMGTSCNQIEHTLPDEMIPTSIQVSAEDKVQFSAVENSEQTLYTNDYVDKPNHGNSSLKESLSLFQKGLFDDGDSDEGDESGDLFRAHSSSGGEKYRVHDAKILLNIPNEMCASLPEQDKDDKVHKFDIESFRRTEIASPAIQIISSSSTRIQNPVNENEMPDPDKNEEIGVPVNLTEYTLDPEKNPFPSTALLLHNLEPHPPFIPAILPQNHSDGDSDSWSSSSSEKDVRPSNIINNIVKSTSDSSSEIKTDKFGKVVVEAKGFSHPAGGTASVLQDESSDSSLLDPDNDNNNYKPHFKGDTVQKGTSLPFRPAEFENRLKATTPTSLSNSLFEEKASHANWSEVRKPRVDYQEVKIVGLDIPKRIDSESDERQSENLWESNDPLWHSPKHTLAELSDQSNDGMTVATKSVTASEGATGYSTNKEVLNSLPSTSVSNKSLESDIPSGSSDKETKGKFSTTVLSQPLGLADSPLSSPLKETKVSSRHFLLFGDDDEELEASLFGPLPKANSKATSLGKIPGRRPSLFDSDED